MTAEIVAEFAGVLADDTPAANLEVAALSYDPYPDCWQGGECETIRSVGFGSPRGISTTRWHCAKAPSSMSDNSVAHRTQRFLCDDPRERANLEAGAFPKPHVQVLVRPRPPGPIPNASGPIVGPAIRLPMGPSSLVGFTCTDIANVVVSWVPQHRQARRGLMDALKSIHGWVVGGESNAARRRPLGIRPSGNRTGRNGNGACPNRDS